MGSLHIPNTQDRICPICMMLHQPTNPCNYDRLVKVIHTQKAQLSAVIKTNNELVDTARAFQNLIKDFTPQAERWENIEAEYNTLVVALKNAKVYALAPSTDPANPAPMMGISVDLLNEVLPPDITTTKDFDIWLKKKIAIPREDHACTTGDCPHDKQAECDAELEKCYGPEKLPTETPEQSSEKV